MACYQHLIQLKAADDTRRSEQASCLVLAPHPDDETLGCGATILRKVRAGVTIHVAIVTDGRHSHRSSQIRPDELAALRRKEAIDAGAALGLTPDDYTFFEYADGSLIRHQSRLAEDIQSMIRHIAPEDVLVSSAVDGHPDHRALNAAARRAITSAPEPVTLYEYPVWFWDARSWVDPDSNPALQACQLLYRPLAALVACRPLAVAASPFLPQKRAALAAYRSQVSNLTGEPGWAVLTEQILSHFLQPQEIFFRVSRARADARL